MIKFFKIKDTEIRRVATVDEAGKVIEIKAIIGKVADLLAREVIFPDNTTGNEDKWLVINKAGKDIKEFSTLKEAKTFCKGRWN